MANSSRLILEDLVKESGKKEAILGKDRGQTTHPTSKAPPIEYGSLAFDVPEESAVLKNLKANMKSAKLNNIRAADKSEPNSNKGAYKNASLWSSRSSTLEQLLKPILPYNGINSWPDYETVSRVIASSAVRSELDMSVHVKPNVPMIDTLIVRLEEASEVRYGFDRLFSQWSYTTEKFELQKEWIDKIELDILVLSLINDHYANLQLKKEQERINAQIKAARTTTAPVNIAAPIAAPVLNYGPRRKVLSEGECRTQALLRAVCPDGSTHTRPLCTSGDVLLALHELLDPTIFLHGCVQLPHVLTDIYERHTEGFYRYIYELNGAGRWQYLRISLPPALHSLQHFVYPSAVLPSTFTAENIVADKVPADLRAASINLIKMVRKHYGKQHMLSKLVVDFEACIETSTKVHLTQQKSLPRSKFPRGTTHNAQHNTQANANANANAQVNAYEATPNSTQGAHDSHTTAGVSIGDKRTNTAVGADVADKSSSAVQHGVPHSGAGTNAGAAATAENAKGVPAPHTIEGINDSQVKYRYRLLHIAETAFQDCLAVQRRDAVCFLDPTAKIFLRNFEGYFHDQWSLLERQRIHERTENFLSQQGGGKPALAAPAAVLPGTDTAALNNGAQLSIDTASGSTKFGASAKEFRATMRVGFASGGNSSTATGGSSPTKRDASPSGGRNTFLVSPRSKNIAKLNALGKGRDREEVETDAAKAAATRLARQLFDKRYAPKVGASSKSGKSRKLADNEDASDASDSADEDCAEEGQSGGESDEGSNSGGNSEADSQGGDQNEENFEPSQTVFRLKSYYIATGKPLPQPAPKGRKTFARNRDTFVVPGAAPFGARGAPAINSEGGVESPPKRATILAKGGSDVEAEGISRPSLLVPKAPHRHSTHRVSVAAAAINATGAFAASPQHGQSPNMGHRKSRTSIAIGSRDRQILARYHISEAHRIEHERRKAEDERTRAEAAARLKAENEAAAARRKSSLYSLYFVTRTFIKRPDTAENARSKSPQGQHAAIAAAAAAAALTGRAGSADQDGAVVDEELQRQQKALARHNKRPSVVAATAARSARRKGRRGATQALSVSEMSQEDADRIYAEDQRKYREVMDRAAIEFLQQSLSPRSSEHNRDGVAVNSELYLAVDDLLHRSFSPSKGREARKGALSPSKMFEEMNKPHENAPAEVGPNKPKVRNDVEFDERAYKLAEKIDLTYLVSSFDPANHSRGKHIVLDDDPDSEGNLEKASMISGTSACADESASITQVLPPRDANLSPKKRELTEAELRKKQAKEYAEYMRKIYDEEMSTMLDSLIDHLPSQLASKVRKALAAKKHRLKLKRRQAYINRRRKVEEIRHEDLNVLQKFYEGQTFLPGDCMTDSSSDDEADRKAKQAETDKMLGDLAHVGAEDMQAMLEARAAEEAAEKAAQEAAEAKRLQKEAAEAEKREKKAKAKADKLAAQAEAAALAAATAAAALIPEVEGTAPVADAPAVPAAAVRRGSIAQMRRTFRTFSLMHLTKVLLDGTLVPKVEEAVELPPSGVSRIGTAATSTDTDRGSDAEADPNFPSRPATGVRMTYSDSGMLDSPVDPMVDSATADVDPETGGEPADARPSTAGRPTSRGVSRPSTRSSMWDLPPLGRAVTPPVVTTRVSTAPRAASAYAVPAIDAITEVPSEVTGTDCSEEVEIPAQQTTPALSGTKLGAMARQRSDLEPTPLKDSALEGSTITDPDASDVKEGVDEPPNGPESELSLQSSTVDLDVLDLLSDLKFANNTAAPSADAFVNRRTTRIASISDSGLKAADGRPPSGLLFSMVKPGTPSNNPLLHSGSKGSPMDKINKAKELPRLPISKLKKPTSGKADAPAEVTNVKQSAKSEPAVTQRQAASQPAPAVLQPTPQPPVKPKGLYIIPGTATVATFAQKPPAQKPSRQIVYTTRVLMQQKLREYINSPVAGENMPGLEDAQFDSTKDDSTDSDLRFKIGNKINMMEFSDTLEPDASHVMAVGETSTSEVYAKMPTPPEELRKGSAELRVRIPTAEKETPSNITTSPEGGVGDGPMRGIAAISADASPSVVDIKPPQAISDSESDCEDSKLQLSMAEWNLILDAAREQALDLNMDILQQNELEDQLHSGDRYDHSPVLGAESEEEFEEDQLGGVMPLTSLHEYYGDGLDSQDEYQYTDDERPMPPLTVGRALRLYGERDPVSGPQNTIPAANSLPVNEPENMPRLAAIGAGGFSLYARTSHTAQSAHPALLPAAEPAVEESMLDKFLKTAGVPLVPTATHHSEMKAPGTTFDGSPTSHRKISPQRAHEQRVIPSSTHAETGEFRPGSPRVCTPKHSHRKLARSGEPEQQQLRAAAVCMPSEEVASPDLRPEPAYDFSSPLTIVKLVKPEPLPAQSPPKQHGLAANAAVLLPQHSKAIVVPVAVLVGDDGDSSIYTL